MFHVEDLVEELNERRRTDVMLQDRCNPEQANTCTRAVVFVVKIEVLKDEMSGSIHKLKC